MGGDNMNYVTCIIWNILQPVNKDKEYLYVIRKDLNDVLRTTQHE